jgi:hypothetical protein
MMVHMGQIMAECDCSRVPECLLKRKCMAEEEQKGKEAMLVTTEIQKDKDGYWVEVRYGLTVSERNGPHRFYLIALFWAWLLSDG